MDLGMEQLMSDQVPTGVTPKRAKDVRITEMKGGFLINKYGNEFYPPEVCVTIDEALKIVNEFFAFAEKDVTELAESDEPEL